MNRLLQTGLFVLLALNVAAPSPAPPADASQFWKHWGDGRGEIATYATTQSRYGELRTGTTVLVFVNEEMARTTRAKIESDRVPPSDRMPVLKCNRIVKFPTGIYDYAITTSTFAAIGAEFGHAPFQSVKISNTTQEWCGNFFGMCVTDRDAMRYTRHSYFEGEGDTDNVPIALPGGEWECEDNLPIRIRELAGNWLGEGESRSIKLFPSFQHQRFMHSSHGFVDATIAKSRGGEERVGGVTYPQTVRWTWTYRDEKGPVSETYVVNAAYPHTILRWESSDGSKGTLITVRREPYWQEHDNASAPLRKKIGL